MSYRCFLPLLLFFLTPHVWTYEAPEDKKDVFARKACPAFLTFTNAAYLAGVTVELPCHCKPEHFQSVVWFFRKHLAGSNETRVLSDHHGNKLLDTEVPHSGDLRSRFFIRLFSLLIFRAGPDDSGIYICGSATRDFFYGYDVDIQGVQTISFIARNAPDTTTKGQKERGQQGPAYPLYQVFTGFQSWTVCDRCGVEGEQVRVGLCYVHSPHLHVRFKRANQTVTSCGSGAVPMAFSHLRGGGATLEVKSCHVTCPTETPPHSSKLHALQRFVGYSSASMPMEVPVFYFNHKADRTLTIGCPNARPNMAVAWDRGSETIYRAGHSPGRHVGSTSNRLTIDSGHHLVFTPAKTEDSGIYYCWLQGRRAAEIRLLVYPHLGRGQSITSHPDFPLAVRVVLSSYSAMTFVFSLLVLTRAGIRHLRDARNRYVE